MKFSFWKSKVFTAFAALALLSLGLDDSFARGGGGGGHGGGFSSGGRSFSSSSSSGFRSSSPSSSSSFFKSSPSPAPAMPKYVAPAPQPRIASAESVKPGFRTAEPTPAPMKKTFDSAGAKANHEAASRESFKVAQAPATQSPPARSYEYKRDTYVQNLRTDLAGEKWKNRQLRQDQAFGGYYNRPSAPIFVQPAYHDPFGNMFFWMWLMDRPSHDRDAWLYHHQGDMDPARLAELKSKDADLDRRLKALEQSGTKADSAYVPPELKGNKDLMYGDDVVKDAAKAENSMSWLWFVLGGLLALGAFVYLVFFKRWNTGAKHAY